MQHFINEGFGWTCRPCRDADARATPNADDHHDRARFFNEGEAEDRHHITLATPHLARWRDDTHTTLHCPHCGTEERMNAER